MRLSAEIAVSRTLNERRIRTYGKCPSPYCDWCSAGRQHATDKRLTTTDEKLRDVNPLDVKLDDQISRF